MCPGVATTRSPRIVWPSSAAFVAAGEGVVRTRPDSRTGRQRDDLGEPSGVVGVMVGEDNIGHVGPVRTDGGQCTGYQWHGVVQAGVDERHSGRVRDEEASHVEADRFRSGDAGGQVDVDDHGMNHATLQN